MENLSVADIERLRGLVLENSSELLGEAELLFASGKFARAYTLAHLSSEALAKLPILTCIGVNLTKGESINWKKIDEILRSHTWKLKALLFVYFLGSGVDPSAKEIRVRQKELSTAELFNELKNVSLYSGVYQGDLYKPTAVITQTLAEQMLKTAKSRFELFSSVEAVTRGRIAELANRPSYMLLLNALGMTSVSNTITLQVDRA